MTRENSKREYIYIYFYRYRFDKFRKFIYLSTIIFEQYFIPFATDCCQWKVN